MTWKVITRCHYKDAAQVDEIGRAYGWGGTTTLCDFALQRGGCGAGLEAVEAIDIFQAIEEKKNQWQGECYADYAWHCMLI